MIRKYLINMHTITTFYDRLYYFNTGNAIGDVSKKKKIKKIETAVLEKKSLPFKHFVEKLNRKDLNNQLIQ